MQSAKLLRPCHPRNVSAPALSNGNTNNLHHGFQRVNTHVAVNMLRSVGPSPSLGLCLFRLHSTSAGHAKAQRSKQNSRHVKRGKPLKRSVVEYQARQQFEKDALLTVERTLEDPQFPQDGVYSLPHAELVRNPKLVMSYAEKILDPHEDFEMVEGGWKAKLKLRWKDKSRESISCGQGTSQKRASKAAWLQAFLALHQDGILPEILPLKAEEITQTTLQGEKSAMQDVYDYCAKYDDLPEVTRSHSGRSRAMRHITKISFPLHGLQVKAIGRRWPSSDVMAAVKFKAAAEAYHKGLNSGTLVVKSSGSLNTSNALPFFKYLHSKDVVAGMPEVVIEEENGLFKASVWQQDQIGPTVSMTHKKGLEDMARLAAAVSIIKDRPDLKSEFLQSLSAHGDLLLDVNPLKFPVDDTAVLFMRNTLAKARQNGLNDAYMPPPPEENIDKSFSFEREPPSLATRQSRDKQLKERRSRYQESSETVQIRQARQELPMNGYTSDVLETIQKNTYSIIIGETGSGKTTQVPQILLDHAIDAGTPSDCNIICTQPRRIAATSVAKRVASERAEPLSMSVGYQVRNNNQRAKSPGSINYCTTGILLLQLQADPDAVLDRVSHIIIDEVHERDKIVDYTMIILKRLINDRLVNRKPAPKVISMSATLDPSLFSPYFQNQQEDGSSLQAPVLRVPGRSFPVTESYLEQLYGDMEKQYGSKLMQYLATDKSTMQYLESEHETSKGQLFPTGQQATSSVVDWKRVSKGLEKPEDISEKLVPARLTAATIAHVAGSTDDGAILVFLPGIGDIQAVQKELLTSKPLGIEFGDTAKYSLFLLHSTLGDADSQAKVFEPVAPGQRKIILSTNIAETSVTIPDIKHVIDTGKSRELVYDAARRLQTLNCVWISKSNAKQRAGRAGRVQDGNYYGLYTTARHESLRSVGQPELLRTDLQDTCLDVVAQKWNEAPREFLAQAIEPPSPVSVDNAMRRLVDIDALTSDEQLTTLGRLLATLPIQPELGKMVVLGIIFRCLDPMIIMGAAHEARQLFVMALPAQRKEVDARKREFSTNTNSDHIAMLNAFREVRAIRQTQGLGAARDFCFRNFIHWHAYTAIESTASAIEDVLMSAKLIPAVYSEERVHHQYGDEKLNTHSLKPHVIKALITAGLSPNVAMKWTSSAMKWRTQNEVNVVTNPGSVNYVGWQKQKASKAESMSSDGGKKEPLLAVYNALSRAGNDDHLLIRENSYISPLALALFGGRLVAKDDPFDKKRGDSDRGLAMVNRRNQIVEVDGWLPFYVKSDQHNVVSTIVELRKALERMLAIAYADLSKSTPLLDDPVRSIFSNGIVDILGMDTNENGVSGKLQNTPKAEDMWEKMKASWKAPNEKENRRPNGGGAKTAGDEGISLAMMDWAAKWEARAKVRAQARRESK